MDYKLTTPCGKCPFSRTTPPFLRRGRVTQMQRDLDRGEFACHQTLDYNLDYNPSYDDDDSGNDSFEPREIPGRTQHCAGALIIQAKTGQFGQMARIAGRIGLFDADALDMDAPVFDSFEEMRGAQRD